jgi:hypothetical protein
MKEENGKISQVPKTYSLATSIGTARKSIFTVKTLAEST